MSKKQMPLRVPPKFPKPYELWEREDGQVFTYGSRGWWEKVKETDESH